MGRDFFINGESMVAVKSASNSAIASLTLLGLAEGPIIVSPEFYHKDANVDAWGGPIGGPAEVQAFGIACKISMRLIHFDRQVLSACINLSVGLAPAEGSLARAGARMGGNAPRFAPGCNYIGLNIASPVGGVPWRFYYTYLTEPPFEFPLGAEKSVVACNWRAIAYTQDPWGGSASQPNTVAGTGSYGALVWDHGADS